MGDEGKEESDSNHGRDSDDSDRGSPRRSRRRNKKPDVVFHTSGGGGAEEILKEQILELEELLVKCKEERNRYKDDAKNTTLELVETERTVKELTGERETIIKQKK